MSEKRSYRIVTMLNPKEGTDDKFNDWYSNAHMPQALNVPGMVSGQRFRLSKEQREGSKPQWQYLAYYEVETDDLQGVIDELKRREGTPELVGTDTISPGGSVMFFEPITEKMTNN
ncbi:MAG: hypothetical protein E5Y02_00600 [Mesorhizobium sp.]|nr:MAG: hypothetical protein E5Y02_00600 [Mesorhizobium sp.]